MKERQKRNKQQDIKEGATEITNDNKNRQKARSNAGINGITEKARTKQIQKNINKTIT